MPDERIGAEGLFIGSDGATRCLWPQGHDDYTHYHDTEWGRPVADDTRLFEKICLEGFQSGLSWLTILRKRDSFRAAFVGFDIDKVAAFDDRDVERLLGDTAIVRHRGKIAAAINNARCARELRREFGSLAAYFWRYEPPAEERPTDLSWSTLRAIAKTPASTALSRDLKARGWRFVGPTTMYAFMQAMGLVNDHVAGCAMRSAVEAERSAFARPR